MNFAVKKFNEELAALLFTFNQHFQKLAWAALAGAGAVEFTPFLEWIKSDAARSTAWAALNSLDSEAAAAAAKANVVDARRLAREYYNGLFILYRDYDKAVEEAYRANYRRDISARELELTGVGA